MVLGAAQSAVLSFDVGGTDIKAGVVDASGTVLGMRRVPTPLDPARPGEAVLDRLAELKAELASEFPQAPAQAAGIIVPGIVDSAAGVGVYSANLGWRNFPFTAEAEKRLGIPVAFDHDVRSAAAVEHHFGASKEFSDVVVMVVGTGIAAAVFSGGKAVTAGGFAGELGHAQVPDPDAGPGSTGSTILEAVGSAGAIAKRYHRASGVSVDGARGVLLRAGEGDAIASRIWADALDALAFTICQCVNIIGTEAVVLGGGLAEAGDDLLEPLRKRVDRILDFQRRPQLIRAQLGQDAGLLGAALNARALLEGTP
ncbi:ROK family protein [Paenarthrobacter aurescens]|uniref:Glucokinase n=1 Tax=Paenarthrobacter aurescens TaxID=43663 RepID=A0A4Y3NDV8_PAEAU|nr:ROK family protein [Paenarthrobacter aurescens]MDO6142985.1 ROK family protein [Paenarthrobacter aurescens]MDO6146830.1 ROK family protein [Paenarthrobacter aurescens]MDO6158076.1 ROK family protein [Paenarthrobacter aurescens]MDO6162061.1 ROK family protein [Paenarthrobacter aurescens]GEB19423.1 glucokinase [Paenarthrobacter aurescens]